jgi:predicted kinase
MLISFSGLPGTGKTTLARALAEQLGAAYLRVDTIEQAIREAGLAGDDIGPAGYMVAYALAEANLKLGNTVIADTVSPIKLTRDGWREVARASGTQIIDVEVICSDKDEHRHRVETRNIDIAGLKPPTWQEVVDREYHGWDRPRIVIDTAMQNFQDTLAQLIERIEKIRPAQV